MREGELLDTTQASNIPQDELNKHVNEVASDQDGFRLLFASRSSWPRSAAPGNGEIHIAVMDSSFNPPHFAHLAMAASDLPSVAPSSASPSSSEPRASQVGPYTARLLLFSVRNIEKTSKPRDASTVQRLEMTLLLAKRLAAMTEDTSTGGVAVGLINEPAFFGKSRIIHRFLKQRLRVHQSNGDDLHPVTTLPTLSFLVGTDTLTRFFDPKFYPTGMREALNQFFAEPPAGDGSLLISARRGKGEANRQVEEEVMLGEEARLWVERGSVRLRAGVEEGLEEVSSSDVRKTVAEGKLADAAIPHEIAEYIQRQGLYMS